MQCGFCLLSFPCLPARACAGPPPILSFFFSHFPVPRSLQERSPWHCQNLWNETAFVSLQRFSRTRGMRRPWTRSRNGKSPSAISSSITGVPLADIVRVLDEDYKHVVGVLIDRDLSMTGAEVPEKLLRQSQSIRCLENVRRDDEVSERG